MLSWNPPPFFQWGAAVTIFVNLAVFPISTERELRTILATSLQHVSTFGQLIMKSFDLTISDEEKELIEYIHQNIRVSTARSPRRLF